MKDLDREIKKYLDTRIGNSNVEYTYHNILAEFFKRRYDIIDCDKDFQKEEINHFFNQIKCIKIDSEKTKTVAYYDMRKMEIVLNSDVINKHKDFDKSDYTSNDLVKDKILDNIFHELTHAVMHNADKDTLGLYRAKSSKIEKEELLDEVFTESLATKMTDGKKKSYDIIGRNSTSGYGQLTHSFDLIAMSLGVSDKELHTFAAKGIDNLETKLSMHSKIDKNVISTYLRAVSTNLNVIYNSLYEKESNTVSLEDINNSKRAAENISTFAFSVLDKRIELSDIPKDSESLSEYIKKCSNEAEKMSKISIREQDRYDKMSERRFNILTPESATKRIEKQENYKKTTGKISVLRYLKSSFDEGELDENGYYKITNALKKEDPENVYKSFLKNGHNIEMKRSFNTDMDKEYEKKQQEKLQIKKQDNTDLYTDLNEIVRLMVKKEKKKNIFTSFSLFNKKLLLEEKTKDMNAISKTNFKEEVRNLTNANEIKNVGYEHKEKNNINYDKER